MNKILYLIFFFLLAILVYEAYVDESTKGATQERLNGSLSNGLTSVPTNNVSIVWENANCQIDYDIHVRTVQLNTAQCTT